MLKDAADTSDIFVHLQNIPDRTASHVRKQFLHNHRPWKTSHTSRSNWRTQRHWYPELSTGEGSGRLNPTFYIWFQKLCYKNSVCKNKCDMTIFATAFTYIHTYTNIHTYIDYIYIYIHTYIHTHIHTHIYTHTILNYMFNDKPNLNNNL
jgi:hypothetical protein